MATLPPQPELTPAQRLAALPERRDRHERSLSPRTLTQPQKGTKSTKTIFLTFVLFVPFCGWLSSVLENVRDVAEFLRRSGLPGPCRWDSNSLQVPRGLVAVVDDECELTLRCRSQRDQRE